jgi:glycosyltransferase 2 family protein
VHRSRPSGRAAARPARALQRVSRLRESPWLRGGLLVLAVGLAVYGLASQWTQVHAALAKLGGYDVAGALACAIAGLCCMMLAWRSLLADLGTTLPVPAATRVMFIGQLGKYVPGAVWAFAAQVELARDYGVPRRRSATASLVGMAATLVVGMIVAGLTLPFASAHAARHYWWVLAITPLAAACLHPKIIKLGLDLVLKMMRQEPLERSVGAGGMARALAWTSLGWLFFGAHAWFLISVFAGKGGGEVGGGHVAALSLGGYALAWAVGFIIIVFPGGIGPRELAFIAVLAPVMPSASALVVALASRVIMTIGDLVWAGTGLVIGRAGRVPSRQPAGPLDGPEVPVRAPAAPSGRPPSPVRDQRPLPRNAAARRPAVR